MGLSSILFMYLLRAALTAVLRLTGFALLMRIVRPGTVSRLGDRLLSGRLLRP